MTELEPVNHELLRKILSQPAAPFREKHVSATLSALLKSSKVPHFFDPVGNIVVGAASVKEYVKLVKTKTTEPLRIFIAHMDHPGFHGVRWVSDSEMEFQWHGGSPTQHLEGASVWIASSTEIFDRKHIQATTHSVTMIPSGLAISKGLVRFNTSEVSRKYPDPVHLYGGFDFREFVWQEGDLVYSKAADDLIGAYAICSMAMNFFKKKKKSPPFIGLLTRAEEVGFIGAIGHFQLGWLKGAKRPLLAVSLETSRTLPGADIGKGPVVRLGDRYTVFDAGALRVFTQLAEEVLPSAYQRRVMDGGSCEATAATVFGIPSIGISVPLGNYHNQSFEGGPDSRGSLGPAPEFVHQKDIAGLQTLCEALLRPKLGWLRPWDQRQSEFKKQIKKYQSLLREGSKL
jgi:putative aminopeptidase FrvX